MYPSEFVSKRASKGAAKWLFLIGLFSQTQIRLGAKIGISEIVCCLVAPVFFMHDYGIYRKDGVSLYFNLLLVWIVGAIFSDWYNHSVFEQIIRGFSVPIVILGVSVCIYHFLRIDFDNLKWLLFGIAVSSVVSIFVFQRGWAGDMASEGDLSGAIEKVVDYKLFWSNLAKTWLLLPVQALYMKTPRLYTVIAMLTVAFVNAISGGRSAFAVSLLAFFVVMIGGKKIEAMGRIRRFFPLLVVMMMALAVTLKSAYSYAATHGYLNEQETIKYRQQTAKGSDIKSLLMSGRGDFFIGLIAALDKPFIGHGSHALDTHGYEVDFLERYGTDSEILNFNRKVAAGYLRHIKSHSHVITYWMWHGVAGLLFWIYIFYLVIQTICKRMDLIPEWFGFLAIVLSDFIWDYFFSPFGLRVNGCMLFCALLILVKMEKCRKRGIFPNMR